MKIILRASGKIKSPQFRTKSAARNLSAAQISLVVRMTFRLSHGKTEDVDLIPFIQNVDYSLNLQDYTILFNKNQGLFL